jgi:hypothetical protein
MAFGSSVVGVTVRARQPEEVGEQARHANASSTLLNRTGAALSHASGTSYGVSHLQGDAFSAAALRYCRRVADESYRVAPAHGPRKL